MKRFIIFYLVFTCFILSASAAPIQWVDFDIPYESLKYAMQEDITTSNQEKHISWIDILSVAACRTGGKCSLASVKTAAEELHTNSAPEELLGTLSKYYRYYHEAYSAVLGGFLGNYAILSDNKWLPSYGLKTFSPIASGFQYSHYDDFGARRSFGFKRKHLGNDLLGDEGTPIVAIESGTIEALGWNRYGGWRIGIRSFDKKRYYYYAHLRKDIPYAPGLEVGQTVSAGDVIGFMGRTGYSDTENVNNIEVNHLHFGMQLIFDESQKECNSEIWINVYNIIKLLSEHQSTLQKTESGWVRAYPYHDLDISELPAL